MMATLKSRRFVLENSAATALIAASIPPMPRPVMMRQIDRSMSRESMLAPSTKLTAGASAPPRMPLVVVTMNMPSAITTRHPSTVGRRPILSATPPKKIEPNAMPMSSIDSTKPSAARSIPHSAAMPGEAKLIERTSNPSSAFKAIVMPTTRICIAVIGFLAIASRGSVVTDIPQVAVWQALCSRA